MSQYVQTSNSMLSASYVEFDNKQFAFAPPNLALENPVFGILKMNVDKTPITRTVQSMFFMVDKSGSMLDRCGNRTKMDCILETLKNMIRFFAENSEITVYVTVMCFDDNVYSILENVKITPDNLESLLLEVEKVGKDVTKSTNIEGALKKSYEYIQTVKRDTPENEINYVFMTDGEITCGSQDVTELKKSIDYTVGNVFIGFGHEHNTKLLSSFANEGNSSYYFIDVIEKSGLVYGEILHEILYKALDNAVITMDNGLIYDWKTNCWVDTLQIGNLIGEKNKTFHVLTSDTELFKCAISATNQSEKFEFHVEGAMVRVASDNSMDNYLFRHRTLVLLFEAMEAENDRVTKQSDYSSWLNNTDYATAQEEINAKVNELKKKMTDLKDEMKKYKDNDASADEKLIKLLCDDLYISYKTLGTAFGQLFISSRQTSQGLQRCYSVNKTPYETRNQFLIPGPPILRRTNAGGLQRNATTAAASHGLHVEIPEDREFEDTAAFDNSQYTVSDNIDTPYATMTGLRLMRSVSSRADETPHCNNLSSE